MSQYLSQVPAQQMRQEQRLTPQLIQSMNILQLNVASLEARIQEELEQNPVLEYEPEEASSIAVVAYSKGEPTASSRERGMKSHRKSFSQPIRPWMAMVPRCTYCHYSSR